MRIQARPPWLLGAPRPVLRTPETGAARQRRFSYRVFVVAGFDLSGFFISGMVHPNPRHQGVGKDATGPPEASPRGSPLLQQVGSFRLPLLSGASQR